MLMVIITHWCAWRSPQSNIHYNQYALQNLSKNNNPNI